MEHDGVVCDTYTLNNSSTQVSSTPNLQDSSGGGDRSKTASVKVDVTDVNKLISEVEQIGDTELVQHARSRPLTALSRLERATLVALLRKRIKQAQALRTNKDREITIAEFLVYQQCELCEDLTTLELAAVLCTTQESMTVFYRNFEATADGRVPPLEKRKINLIHAKTRNYYPPNYIKDGRTYAWWCRHQVPHGDKHAVCAKCIAKAGDKHCCDLNNRCPVCEDAPDKAVNDRLEAYNIGLTGPDEQFEKNEKHNKLGAQYLTQLDILRARTPPLIERAAKYMWDKLYASGTAPDIDYRLFYDNHQETAELMQAAIKERRAKGKKSQDWYRYNMPRWLLDISKELDQAAQEGRQPAPISMTAVSDTAFAGIPAFPALPVIEPRQPSWQNLTGRSPEESDAGPSAPSTEKSRRNRKNKTPSKVPAKYMNVSDDDSVVTTPAPKPTTTTPSSKTSKPLTSSAGSSGKRVKVDSLEKHKKVVAKKRQDDAAFNSNTASALKELATKLEKTVTSNTIQVPMNLTKTKAKKSSAVLTMAQRAQPRPSQTSVVEVDSDDSQRASDAESRHSDGSAPAAGDHEDDGLSSGEDAADDQDDHPLADTNMDGTNAAPEEAAPASCTLPGNDQPMPSPPPLDQQQARETNDAPSNTASVAAIVVAPHQPEDIDAQPEASADNVPTASIDDKQSIKSHSVLGKAAVSIEPITAKSSGVSAPQPSTSKVATTAPTSPDHKRRKMSPAKTKAAPSLQDLIGPIHVPANSTPLYSKVYNDPVVPQPSRPTATISVTSTVTSATVKMPSPTVTQSVDTSAAAGNVAANVQVSSDEQDFVPAYPPLSFFNPDIELHRPVTLLQRTFCRMPPADAAPQPAIITLLETRFNEHLEAMSVVQNQLPPAKLTQLPLTSTVLDLNMSDYDHVLPQIHPTAARLPAHRYWGAQLPASVPTEFSYNITDWRMRLFEQLSRGLVKALASAEGAISQLVGELQQIVGNHALVSRIMTSVIPQLIYAITDAAVFNVELLHQLVVTRRQAVVTATRAAVGDYLQMLTAPIVDNQHLF